MQIIEILSGRKDHVKSSSKQELVFSDRAVEIAIVNRVGRIIWKKVRGESTDTLRWNGSDDSGVPAPCGSYLCKITYPDELVVYVPFVFLQK